MSNKVTLRIKKVRPIADQCLPQYMSPGASGMDLCVACDEPITLNPLERKLVPTGIAISVPEGYEAQIRPRSGLAIKHGITLLNTPGTIDSDYRGEVCLVIINLGNEPFIVEHGMRLAQMVIARYVQVETCVVDEVSDTTRGEGGFGHTGI